MASGFERIRQAQLALAKAQVEEQDALKAMERTFGDATVSFEVNELEITVTVKKPLIGTEQDKVTLTWKDMVALASYIVGIAKAEEGTTS